MVHRNLIGSFQSSGKYLELLESQTRKMHLYRQMRPCPGSFLVPVKVLWQGLACFSSAPDRSLAGFPGHVSGVPTAGTIPCGLFAGSQAQKQGFPCQLVSAPGSATEQF